MKQGLCESSLDYANRFKNVRDVMNTKNGGVIKLTELNESTREPSKNLSFLQTCSLNKGIKQFGERGRKAALKE